MNLRKKKSLATRTLKVGKERVVFLKSRLDEIKEAITKQDIRDLKKEGAIIVKEIEGRRKYKIFKFPSQSSGKRKIKRKSKKRGPGNIRKKVNKRKQEYVKMTRKLRKYVAEMKKQGRLSREEIIDIRKKIRNRIFRSKAHLKEYIGGLRK